MKKIIFAIALLILFSSVFALDECKEEIQVSKTCIVTTPAISTTAPVSRTNEENSKLSVISTASPLAYSSPL